MHLLIPAAGMGRRMGSDRNKLLLKLRSQPLITWTLLAAEAAAQISWVGIIAQPTDWLDLKEILAALSLTKPVQLIQGGATRQESVYNGLQALSLEAEQVLIHDGARCLATPDLLDRCAEAIRGVRGSQSRALVIRHEAQRRFPDHASSGSPVEGTGIQGSGVRDVKSSLASSLGDICPEEALSASSLTPDPQSLTPGVIAAVPVKDTIKVVDETGLIQSTPDRRQLWAAQTPQAFDVQMLKQCHAEGRRQGWEVTDDAALFEKCNYSVRIVEGEETNLKITTKVDLAIAEFILQQRLGTKK